MHLLLSTAMGLILGSFCTLLVWRLHKNEKGIIAGRSHCPYCKHTLGVKNLVPLFSYIFQKGKCSFCNKKISIIYPLTEASFALSFFLVTQKFYNTPEFFPWLIATTFILILFWYDVRFMEVDMRISIPAIILAGAWMFFREPPIMNFVSGGILGFLFYALQYYLSKKTWVGDGDMQLGAFLGLLLGWKMLIGTLFIAYIIGAIFAIILLINKKAKFKSSLPMGAFLMPSAIFFLISGQKLIDWYFHFIGI